MVARLVRDQEVVGSSPVTSTKNSPSSFDGGLFLHCAYLTGLEGGGVSESERFADRAGNRMQGRKLHQPCGLCTGARRQRRKSRHLNQKEKLRFYAGFFFLHSGNGFDCGSWSRHKRAIAVTGSPKKGAAFFWGEEERRRMCGGSAAPAAGSISMFNLGRRWSRMVPDKRTCNNFGIKGLTGL